MPELMPLLPYALAALLGAWCAWLTWAALRMRTETQYLRRERDRLTVEVVGLQNQVGWDDNMTKTQVLDPDVMARFRRQ